MDVEITNLTIELIRPRAIVKLAKKAGRLAGLSKGVLVSIVFVDTAKMRELNKNYRDKDEPTDVLSFLLTRPPTSSGAKQIVPERSPKGRSRRSSISQKKDSFITPKFVRSVFGEVFLCPEIIRTRAVERGMSEEEYQKLLIVHAMLHLKGLEHDEGIEAEKMEEEERKILDKI